MSMQATPFDASTGVEDRVRNTPRRGVTLAILGALVVGAMILTACQPTGAVLQGRLTDTVAGPIAGIQVRVYSSNLETVVATTTTDFQGDYSFLPDALADGTYRVRFSDAAWWQNATDWASATDVSVTDGSTTTIDATISAARGAVSGTVSNGSAPLPGVTVTAHNTTASNASATTTTQSDGTYTFGALPAATYRFKFSLAGYTTRYSASATTPATAPVVDVTDDAAITGIDTTLEPESPITGSVSDGTSPIAHTLVLLYDQTAGQWVTFALTGDDGRFTLNGLNQGTYTVGFIDGSDEQLSIYGSAGSDPAGGAPITMPPATHVDLGALTWGTSTSVPTAPPSVTATAGNAQATVSWAAPATDGGAAISAYTVTAAPGGQSCATTGSLSCVVTGLINGTAATFTVTATNVVGEGPASAASASVTPIAPATPSHWDMQSQAPYLAPSGRGAAAMTALSDGTALLFGGAKFDASAVYNDTWVWNGTTWTEQHPATAPTARVGAAIASLADGHAILFGGTDPSTGTTFDDTWIWNGTTWTEQHPATAPSARFYASATTLSNGDVLLFGGSDGVGTDDDTWIWNGTTWTEQHPTVTPPARALGALSALPEGKAILFGGADLSDFMSKGDTWIWTGTDWAEQHPETSPSARAGASTSTLSNGTVLLFGGTDLTSATYFDDTWIWDGTNWVTQNATHVPPARYAASMTTLSDGSTVLIDGLNDDSELPNTTWTWDGTDWSTHQLKTWPQGTTTAATATLSFGDVLLFGGTNSGSYDTVYNKTWMWNGDAWTDLQPADAPPARAGAAMAALPNNHAVLFGGFSPGAGTFDDTWVWDGDTWTHLDLAVHPYARQYASMATLANGDVVLFGGSDTDSYSVFGDTWIFDGATWTQVTTANAPSPRFSASMEATADGGLLLFGGTAKPSINEPYDDTWHFDGTTWTELAPVTSPSARWGSSAATLPDGRVILVGGLDADGAPSPDAMWIWNGTTWSQESTSGAPPGRGLAAMAVDADGRIVFLGGSNISTETILNDFWIWTPEG